MPDEAKATALDSLTSSLFTTPQNPEALELEGGAQAERHVRKLLSHVVAVEPVVRWVNSKAAGDDLLVERGEIASIPEKA